MSELSGTSPAAAIRTILHADMDAFYASVEQRDDPRLRGKPVVVGGLGRRGVVATASYEARRFGVRSAIPTAVARRLCPDATFLPLRMDRYLRDSARIRAVFERFTPLVEPLSLDEAFLDVTASRTLFGDGATIAASIQAEVAATTGLTVSIGVASCKFIAKVASDLRKPAGVVVVCFGDERAFLDPLPIARLWGAGPVAQQKLAALGLSTLGDLRRASIDRLAAAVGRRSAVHFAALAQGDDPRPVEPRRDTQSIGQETTFDIDLCDDEGVARVLLELSEGVGRRLRKAGLRGRVVQLKLRFPPFRTITRQRTLDRPTDDDLTIAGHARELCATARAPGQPLRLAGVTLADLGPAIDRPRQGGLFDVDPAPADARHDRLTRAVDAIRDRFGERSIRRGG